jgi:hypothetical protein
MTPVPMITIAKAMINISIVSQSGMRRKVEECTKKPAETRRLILGLVGTGIRAANQAASVVRAASTPHADRTLVGHARPGVSRLVLMTCVVMMCLCCCKCERA